MTDPKFETLLQEAKKAHRQYPEVGAFTSIPDDLTPTPLTPRHLPSADLFYNESGLVCEKLGGFRDAIYDAGSVAYWRDTYKGTNIGEDFLNRFGCYTIIGDGGAWNSPKMSAFMVHMPANLYYTWHHHPAEELYFIIAGEAEFYREGHRPVTLGEGDTMFHSSNLPHAMCTKEHPVLAYILWRNHLDIKPVLTEREVLQ